MKYRWARLMAATLAAALLLGSCLKTPQRQSAETAAQPASTAPYSSPGAAVTSRTGVLDSLPSGASSMGAGSSAAAVGASSAVASVAGMAASAVFGGQSTAAQSSKSSGVPASSPAPLAAGRLMVGYYGGWAAAGGFSPDNIQAGLLDEINYSFAGIDSGNRITTLNGPADAANFQKLRALKADHMGLRVCVAVGGWDDSSQFSSMAATAAGRETFAASCAEFLESNGFDGIDIDWEYPSTAADKANFTALLACLRQRLDALGAKNGGHYGLSIAGGVGAWYLQNIETAKIAPLLDYAVVMAYDVHGPWDGLTGQNAPLYAPQGSISADSGIKSWVAAGFPAGKLVLGVPLYGYVYKGVSSAQSGLGQPFASGSAAGYDTIASKYLTDVTLAHFTPAGSDAPCLFGGSTFVSYDDAASLAQKAAYARQKGLRGVSAWELSYDRGGTLLRALQAALG